MNFPHSNETHYKQVEFVQKAQEMDISQNLIKSLIDLKFGIAPALK